MTAMSVMMMSMMSAMSMSMAGFAAAIFLRLGVGFP